MIPFEDLWYKTSSKTCLFRPLWLEDLRPGQATGLGRRGTLMAGEMPGPGFAGFFVRAGFSLKFYGDFFRKKF